MASKLFSWTVAAALAALGIGAIACTSKSSGCDDSKCAPGNKCLTADGETKCRKTCTSNSDPANACPYGYTCVSADPQPAFCVADTTGFTTPRKGQFGAPCNPTGGIDNNPDCDITNFFWCFAKSPTDGSAYCTRYDCTTDRDCAAGFYCDQANVGPSATTTNRHVGQTRAVCQKRAYCAPCVADLDCPPDKGRPQHCVPTADGSASFCSPECTSNSTCNNEAACSPLGSDPTIKTCYPRAGTCKGDGSYCSPCRSDADCGQDGACVKGQYTTEHFCAKKAGSPCQAGAKPNCPAIPMGVPAKHSVCSTDDSAESPPRDYCSGIYLFVDTAAGPCTKDTDCPVIDKQGDHEPCVDQVCFTSDDFGCYTPNRSSN